MFLLTLDCNLAFYCADAFSRFLLLDFLHLSFDQGLIPLFSMSANLLKIVDEELYMLITCDESQPIPLFMTSWPLTFFSHDIENLDCCRRMFDFILAEHPLIIVYICVSLIIECQDYL